MLLNEPPVISLSVAKLSAAILRRHIDKGVCFVDAATQREFTNTIAALVIYIENAR